MILRFGRLFDLNYPMENAGRWDMQDFFVRHKIQGRDFRVLLSTSMLEVFNQLITKNMEHFKAFLLVSDIPNSKYFPTKSGIFLN